MLNQELQVYRRQIDELVKDLHQLTIDIRNEELAGTVSELRNRINEPFMFVIVGEVKAGKSSFINALLATGKEICKVAPAPMTDTVQQVTYGEVEKTVEINPYLKRIMLPVDILKEISVVDTPGTNTIIAMHQEITERFIPSSDLIVFVFEAKNPYRQSAWDFFDFIHQEWHKKIVFVLQQADLMNREDLEINIQGLKRQATNKGMNDPIIFPVSAKLEQEGELVQSGFKPVREYIGKHITGGKAPYLKLQNNLVLAQTIGGRIAAGIETRQAQFKADHAFRKDISQTLAEQSQRSQKQVDLLVENLLAEYDRITFNARDEISEGLNFFSLAKRSLLSIFSKETSIKEWLKRISEKMENDLTRSFNEKLSDGVVSLADSIQQMAKLIDLKIQQSQSILQHDHELFGYIADKRSGVMRDLQERFSAFLRQGDSFVGKEVFAREHAISPNIATGSGLAVIGIILAAVTKASILDITGGLIAALGFLVAGVTVSVKRRGILKELKAELLKGRNRLETEIAEKLKAYIQHIRNQIDEKFQDFDAMLVLEEKQLSDLNDKHSAIARRISNMELSVEQLLKKAL